MHRCARTSSQKISGVRIAIHRHTKSPDALRMVKDIERSQWGECNFAGTVSGSAWLAEPVTKLCKQRWVSWLSSFDVSLPSLRHPNCIPEILRCYSWQGLLNSPIDARDFPPFLRPTVPQICSNRQQWREDKTISSTLFRMLCAANGRCE